MMAITTSNSISVKAARRLSTPLMFGLSVPHVNL
jgi:hypothetical protein